MSTAQTLRKSYNLQPGRPEFNDEELSIVSVVSTDSVDRDGEVVVPGGLDLLAFRKNPVVVVCHQYDKIPVAKCLWIKVEGQLLKAKTKFRDNETGRDYYEAYKGGFLNGFSIGFIPDRAEYGPPTRKELELNPHWKGAKAVIRKAELVEYSVVPIPCNRDALARAIQSGDLILKTITKDLGIKSEDDEREEQEREEEKKKKKRKEADDIDHDDEDEEEVDKKKKRKDHEPDESDEDKKKKRKTKDDDEDAEEKDFDEDDDEDEDEDEEKKRKKKKRFMTSDEYLASLDPKQLADKIRLGVIEKINVPELVAERLHVAKGGV